MFDVPLPHAASKSAPCQRFICGWRSGLVAGFRQIFSGSYLHIPAREFPPAWRCPEVAIEARAGACLNALPVPLAASGDVMSFPARRFLSSRSVHAHNDFCG